MLSGIGSLLILIAITVLPVKLAAGFVGAERDSWLFSTLAVVLGTVAVFASYKLVGGNLPGIALAFVALLATYAIVLKTTLGSAFGLAVIVLLLQIAIISVLASAGFSILKTVTP
jgi:hypothetical protein